MEKRMILAPISANKWQEPCLNLAAILDILVFFCNIRMSAGQMRVFSWAHFLSYTL